MKKLLPHIFALLLASSLSAQINFSIVKKDVQCNNTEYGSIEINVVSSNPPYTYNWSSGQTTPVISGLTLGTYSVTITDNLGNDTVGIVYIGVKECAMQPNLIITPNDDGVHDVWTIANAEFFPQARVLIFNRLGQKVFEHNGYYEPWDGKDLFGVPVPDASYFYVIWQKASDESSIIKGSMTVIH
jgi:gliding motility-associated-like protein